MTCAPKTILKALKWECSKRMHFETRVKTIRTLKVSNCLKCVLVHLKSMISFHLFLYNLPLYKAFILYKIKTFWFLVTYQKCYDYNIKVAIQPWKKRYSQLFIQYGPYHPYWMGVLHKTLQSKCISAKSRNSCERFWN